MYDFVKKINSSNLKTKCFVESLINSKEHINMSGSDDFIFKSYSIIPWEMFFLKIEIICKKARKFVSMITLKRVWSSTMRHWALSDKLNIFEFHFKRSNYIKLKNVFRLFNLRSWHRNGLLILLWLRKKVDKNDINWKV